MASNVAPPKNTGGGGFVFEDDVCAWFLAAMLTGEPVFGANAGPPVRLEFQTRPDGWFLDDILVTTAVGANRHRFALSVKSNAQFTAASAPSDFVEAAWEQWFHIGSTVFDKSRDFIGLVTAPLSGAAATSVSGLSEKARVNDPGIFPGRLATPNWATADERALFSSFACPASLGQTTTEVDTASLLQRLRFLQRDFGAIASEAANHALELCRRAVRSNSSGDAQSLWSILRELASELRPHAGSLTLDGLIDNLRARVALANYPDDAADWATLDARSSREAALVRDSIADRVHLPRDEQVAGVIHSLTADVHVALLGTSGVGKSAVAKAAFNERRANAARTLWIDASSLAGAADFGAFETSLQLRHPLGELLARETSRDPVVIIDGLDRLYSGHAFRTAASLLRLAAGGAQAATRWRVLAVCQSQEWPRVVEELQRAGAAVTRWRNHEASSLREVDLEPVRAAAPALGRLLLQPRIGALLTNLKLLDLVVRRLDAGTDIDASGWVGESSVAEWFWGAEIDRGSDGLARGQFARGLALAQADQLAATVSVDSLDASSLSAAQSLSADQLLVRAPGDRLSFAHDLYGDWARLRVLLNHRADLATFLQGRHASPLWHRAIRLLGIHLLERGNGVDEWKTLMAAFDRGSLTIVRDLLLEAPAFAMNAGPLLRSIFPDLVAGDGVLLKRLLTRFLAFATVPNEHMQEVARDVGIDANAARAAFRRPHWPYWVDVLFVLHAHRDDALRVAAPEVAKIVEMWLEFAPPGTVRRSEAAELAVVLGQRALDSRANYAEKEERRRFYKCALMAGPERPDEVSHIARTAAERIPRPATSPEDTTPASRSPSIFGPGVMRGPWPDGPLGRVDDEFQKVVQESSSIQHLYRVRPDVAREVILATLIEEPHEVHWGTDLHERELGLAHRNWQPALFTRGPFLACLRENFQEGLELIMLLVEFATDRSNEQATRKLDEWRARALADGRSESEIAEAEKNVPQQVLVLHDGAKELTFSGDAGSYGWGAGTTCQQGYSPLPPSAVASALMALEQYFYQLLDAGQDIADEMARTLSRSRSVAPLGILIDVGKRVPSLFNGPLRALLSSPELYSWDITKTVHGRTHLMIGAVMEGEPFVKLAQQFHALEHRKSDLRNVATRQLLTSADMQVFFSLVREWWKKRRAAGEQLIDIVDRLDLWFDPANYEKREDPTHGQIIINVALERAQAEQATKHQDMNDLMLVTGFPVHCRTILDERRGQTDAQLDELWQTWKRIRKLAEAGPALPGGEQRFGDEYVNAIAGGIAVLLWHDVWLSQDAARRPEVEETLESMLGGDLPERNGLHSEHDVSTWSWDCFVADAAAMLWARQPQDVRWRRMVAELVFAEKYATVRVLFSRCAEHRTALGPDFERLCRLAVDWAHVRDRVNVLRASRRMVPPIDGDVQSRLESDLTGWMEEKVTAFIDGTSSVLSGAWSRFEEAPRFAEIDALRRRSSDAGHLDFHLVRSSHEWLPLPAAALGPDERARVIHFWKVALDIVAARPRADLRRRDHQYPHEDEVWVLQNVAAVVLQLQHAENPRLFWEAVIDLHSEAHDWPEKFLNALHRRALSAESTPGTYEPVLREVVQHAFSDVNGKRRWPRHEEVWDALIGIDYWVSDCWADRHADLVLRSWDVISLWMERAPQEGRRLGKFAQWLSKPHAASVRVRVLPWLLDQLGVGKKRERARDDEARDNVAKLLNVVWDSDQIALRASSQAFAAFRRLLAYLVEHQNSLGLELQGRIGGLA